MKSPRGFALLDCIRSSERGDLHLAHEEATGRQVVLRSYPGPDGATAARRACHRLTELAGPGVPRVLEALLDRPEPVLVLEAPGGTAVTDYAGTDVGTCTHIAAQLAAILRHVHAKRWVHAGLCPGAILVTGESHEVLLVDFDNAFPLGEQDGCGPRGDPTYMAPEQFGRMERGVDFRSDLYSLGATLFTLFTGRPPFETRDRLELMHAHMARLPPAPRELRAGLPPILSSLLLKLLEKEPEDRYQTAHALHEDLLRFQELWARGDEVPQQFMLGAGDAASRPLFGSHLYGREPELAVLTGALERVRRGACELILIRGSSGAGKSALVAELQARAIPPGWVARGKFDLYQRDQPYLGFRVACETLAHQILVRGDLEIEEWRKRLHAGLGPNTSVLVEWIPDWEFILGEVAPSTRLEAREAQVRLVRTVIRFFRAACRPEEPVLLFLDDLQWADSGSELLLSEIIHEMGAPGLLIVGTCRSEEDPASSVTRMIEAFSSGSLPVSCLDLEPLAPDAMVEMLADALDTTPARASGLAEIVLTKTENNVFLAQQFVEHMRTLGHIRYASPDGWRFDLEAIAAADISDDAVAVVAARIARLDPLAREVLVVASFVGDRFDRHQVGALLEREGPDLERALRVLSEAGLIVACQSGFRFVHNRIREAAQDLKDESGRERLHYARASILLKEMPEPQQAAASAEIADHFNRALRLVPPDTRPKVVQLNVWAAQRALEAGAPEAARGYVGCGWKLATDCRAQLDDALSFELDMLQAEVWVLASEYEEAEAIAAALAARDLSPLDLARTAALRMRIFTLVARERGSWVAEDALRATEIGVEALRKLRAPYPSNPGLLRTALAIVRTYVAVRHLTAEDFLRESGESDERQRAILRIETAFDPIYWARPNRVLLASACRIRRFREGYAWGYLPNSLVGMGMAFLSGLGQRDIGERFARIANELIEGEYPTLTPGAAAMGAHYLVYGWMRHPSQTADRIEAWTQATLEEGDLPMVSAGGSIVSNLRLQAGEPIATVIEAYRSAEDFAKRAHDNGLARLAEESRCILEWLQYPEVPAPDAPPCRVARDPAAETIRGFFWLIMGDPRGAFDALERAAPLLAIPDHMVFHRALSAASALARASRRDRSRYRTLLRRDRRILRQRARMGPRNFRHQQLLVDAECARAKGRLDVALDLGTRAAQLALEERFPIYAALALERVADLLVQRNRRIEGGRRLRQAMDLYAHWGARAKVSQLQRAYPQLLGIAAEPSTYADRT